MSFISFFKGWVGEMQGNIAAKIRLDSRVYRSINNVTIQTANGTTPRLITSSGLVGGTVNIKIT